MFEWTNPKSDLDFMGYARYFIGVSGILVLLSLGSLIYPGPRLGTDFIGGTEVEVAFTEPVEEGRVREVVAQAGFDSPDIVHIDNPANAHQFMIRVGEVSALDDAQKQAITAKLCLVDEKGVVADEASCPPALRTSEVKFSPGGDKVSVRFMENVCGTPLPDVACPPRDDIKALLGGSIMNVEKRAGANNPVVQNPRDNKVEFFFKSKGDQIMDALKASLGKAAPAAPLRVEWIGAKAGSDLRDAAIKSLLLAVVMIMIYIAFRFDVRFAPGAIVALIHDIAIAMGAMVLTQHEVTLSTVAALLTILGYSINDTVVIYDRIRENLGRYRKMSFPNVINRSLTETMARTLKTSSFTALALVPFLFWGTQAIKDFAYVMLVGMTAGVYSTVYIAAPLTEFIDRRIFGKSIKKKKRRVPRKKGAPPSEAPAQV